MFKKFNVTVIDKVLTLGNDNTTLEESGKVDERHLKLSHKQYKEFVDHAKKTGKRIMMLRNETVVWA